MNKVDTVISQYCFVITIYGNADNFNLFNRESGWNFSFPLNFILWTNQNFRTFSLSRIGHVISCDVVEVLFHFPPQRKGCEQNSAGAFAA